MLSDIVKRRSLRVRVLAPAETRFAYSRRPGVRLSRHGLQGPWAAEACRVSCRRLPDRSRCRDDLEASWSFYSRNLMAAHRWSGLIADVGVKSWKESTLVVESLVGRQKSRS